MLGSPTSAHLPGTRRNGILTQIHRFLNTLGSWDSYRDLARPEEIPDRLAQITTTFFGVGLDQTGFPRASGILGAIMAVHALEQVTGSLATLGLRLLVRSEALGHYRGLTLRQSPFTPRAARALRWLIGSRLLAAQGYYFFESGRPWHNQTLTVHLWDASRTLTQLRGYSLPYREYYFDRAILPQTAVDVVKGYDPAAVAGFIGSVNELENAAGLGYLKRAFLAANWLLIDPDERAEAGPGPGGDYPGLVNPSGPGRWTGGSGTSRSPTSSPPAPFGDRPASYPWPSTVAANNRAIPANSTNRVWQSTFLKPVAPSAASLNDPHLRIKDRYHAPDGRDYPLLVQGLVRDPITMTSKARAIYYDGQSRRWRDITDTEARVTLAREVEAGRLKVTVDWEHQL